jgi:hypothetical protein
VLDEPKDPATNDLVRDARSRRAARGRRNERWLGIILLLAGILPAVGLLVLGSVNSPQGADADSASMAAAALLLLEIAWLIPGLILVLAGLWFVRRSSRA